MSVSRRRFLGTLAATSTLAVNSCSTSTKTGIPTRVLGRTGQRVSILTMGGGSRLLAHKEEDTVLEALNRVFDRGVTYVDTAFGYGNGRSEELVGKAIKPRRKEIFVATKVPRRNGDEALRIIEGSLKRLQVDQIDLLHIHNLQHDDDLAAIEADDGVLNVLYTMRDQKVARFIGITSHTSPATLSKALERHDFDCTQMALNPAQSGNYPGVSFETGALPVAVRKDLGIIAMKVYAQGRLGEQAPVEKLLHYALSLPVTTAVVGMPSFEYIEENLRIAEAFRPMPEGEMRELSRSLSARNRIELDRYFASHADA